MIIAAKTIETKAAPRERVDWWQGGIMALLLAILIAFVLYPVLRVL